ncbi:MAG: hypothetical protein ACI915_003445 [Gammaproteobacteria bacterium]|jgi:hypothetical protein
MALVGRFQTHRPFPLMTFVGGYKSHSDTVGLSQNLDSNLQDEFYVFTLDPMRHRPTLEDRYLFPGSRG